MSQQTVRARRALHALADGDLPLLESCFAENFVFHGAREGEPAGRSGLHHRAILLSTTLHHATLQIERAFESGPMVCCLWKGRAVHRGDLLGVAPTSRAVTTTGITVFRFVGGLIVDEWTEFDGLGLLTQLGPR